LNLDRELATVASTIAEHGMLDPGERVLVAFSGGADSTALAVLLTELGYSTILGHVDHGMRADSSRDAEHCARTAELLGRPFLCEKVEVIPATQAEARKVRYAALQRMIARCGASKVATGHSLDDQAETVRMRLDRAGFAMGIPPVRDNVVRPVLGLRRADLERVCAEANVLYIEDPSNRDPRYTRVRVRSELAAESDDYVLGLAAAAEAARKEAHVVAREAERAYARCVRFEAGEAVIDRTDLRALDKPAARQLLLRAARNFGIELSGRLLGDILTKVLPVTGARLSLGGGLSIWAEREKLVIGQWAVPAHLAEVGLSVPGVTRLPEWELEVVAEAASVSTPLNPSKLEELFDADVLGEELSLRQWRPGDRFEPLGAKGSKKLQDFFVDAGIPRRLRSRVPLIVARDRIAWVVGHRLDRRFRLTSSSTRAMRLRAVSAPAAAVPA
jgi:tRNA(Ile)-lysidine synthase